MKIAKSFYWEMGHRLPFHQGKCINLHGHSYRADIGLTGEPDANGILMDYYDLKILVAPLIERMDHAFIVFSGDKELISLLEKMNSKMFLFDYQSTAENLCLLFVDEIKSNLPSNIETLTVRVRETSDTYAETEHRLIHR